MEQPVVSEQLLSQFTEANPVKVLFIKLTTEKVKSRYTLWPDLPTDSPARFMAAEIEAPNSLQLITLNIVQSSKAIASKQIQPIEAIFFVIDPNEFEATHSGQADNLQAWLKCLKDRDDFKQVKQFFLVNTTPSTFGKTDFSVKLQRLITEESNEDESVVILENETDIICCPYPDHEHSSNKPIDQSIVCNKSSIYVLLERNFSQHFASIPHEPPKPPRIASKQTLKRSIEMAFYAGFLFLSTIGVVILLGAILGGASGGWIDIIESSSSWIFNVNLLNTAIEAVFNGLGTSWSLGVVISAFLVAGLVAAAVVSWGAYDHFHPELVVEDINGEGWEITEIPGSNILKQKEEHVISLNPEKPPLSASSRGLSAGSREIL